jgi:hypothetical protein
MAEDVKKELLTKDDGRYIVFYSAEPVEEKTEQEPGGVKTDNHAGGQTVLRERCEKVGDG